MKPTKQVLGALVVISVILLAACSTGSNNVSTPGRSGPSSGGAGPASASGGGYGGFYMPPGAVFQATFTSNTVRLDFPTVQKALRSMSPDARVFVFDASDPHLGQLSAEKVMFLEHLGARRIVKVQKQGSELDLLTAPAALTDFIENGHIGSAVAGRNSRIVCGRQVPYRSSTAKV